MDGQLLHLIEPLFFGKRRQILMLRIADQLNPVVVEAFKKAGERQSGTVDVRARDFDFFPLGNMNHFQLEFFYDRGKWHAVFCAVFVVIVFHFRLLSGFCCRFDRMIHDDYNL